jgi:heme O synthase-like polyprenyltransferase
MRYNIIEHIWKLLSKSRLGRFLAAFIIGGLVGFFCGASVSHEPAMLVMATVGTAVIGLVAVAILELLDSGRKSSPPQRTQRRPFASHQIPPKIDAIKPPVLPPPQSPSGK